MRHVDLLLGFGPRSFRVGGVLTLDLIDEGGDLGLIGGVTERRLKGGCDIGGEGSRVFNRGDNRLGGRFLGFGQTGRNLVLYPRRSRGILIQVRQDVGTLRRGLSDQPLESRSRRRVV